MKDIQEIKIKFIDLIVHMADEAQLRQLFHTAVEVSARSAPLPPQPRHGTIQLRKDVTKEHIFAEQGNKAPDWETHHAILGDLNWEHSSEELMGFLD